MNQEVAHPGPERGPAVMGAHAERIAVASWGLFFLWLGIALWAGFHAGVILLGIGIVTLGAQLARVLFGLSIERFWVVVGFLFALGGAWQLFAIEQSLVPLLLILAGGALVATAGLRKPRRSVCPSCCRSLDD